MSDSSKTNHIVGGAVFGLLARFWQLGIQKRPMSYYLPGHVASSVICATLGYVVWKHDQNMQRIMVEGHAALEERKIEKAKAAWAKLADRNTAEAEGGN